MSENFVSAEGRTGHEIGFAPPPAPVLAGGSEYDGYGIDVHSAGPGDFETSVAEMARWTACVGDGRGRGCR